MFGCRLRFVVSRIDSDYSLDGKPDASIQEAQNSRRAGEPLAIRIQPQLYTRREGRHREHMYRAWRGVYWRLKCSSLKDAIAVRDALASLFLLLQVVDAKVVKKLLDGERKRVVESATSETPGVEIAAGAGQLRDLRSHQEDGI